MSIRLVLGTGNRKKVTEIRAMLPPDGPVELVIPAELDNAIKVEETGTTFAENARLKSTVQAKHLGRWVLAEDSGLSVLALDGAPGVYSARFSGEAATDEKNNDLLLEKLQGVELSRRKAYYSCSLSLSNPEGEEVLTGQGQCHGRIIEERRGCEGFGYDPLFEIPEYHLTFGQLGPAVKKALSHRSRALRAFLPKMMGILGSNLIEN